MKKKKVKITLRAQAQKRRGGVKIDDQSREGESSGF